MSCEIQMLFKCRSFLNTPSSAQPPGPPPSTPPPPHPPTDCKPRGAAGAGAARPPLRSGGWGRIGAGLGRAPGWWGAGPGRSAERRSPTCVRSRGRARKPLLAPCLPPPPPARPPGRPRSGRRRLGGASAPAIRPRRRRLAPKAARPRAADKTRGGGRGAQGELPAFSRIALVVGRVSPQRLCLADLLLLSVPLGSVSLSSAPAPSCACVRHFLPYIPVCGHCQPFPSHTTLSLFLSLTV